MSKRFRNPLNTLLILGLAISAVLLTYNASFSADAYTVPQTTEVKLAWEPCEPAPDGYRIYQRKEAETYDYNQPSWTGSDSIGTVYNLDWDTAYHFVVRAYRGEVESSNSNEVSFFSRSSETTTYSILATAGEHGIISPGDSVPVNQGSDQAFSITPDAGYHVADVLVDGVSIGAVSSHTFDQVTEDHTITAAFAIDSHILSASAGINGRILPAGIVKVDHGASQRFSILPNDGYHVEDVSVNGISMGAPDVYTFIDVSAAHAIHVTFAKEEILVNQLPNADAGPDQNVEETREVTLSGSNSIDFDDGIVSYQWRQTSGAEVVLNTPGQPETTFTAPEVDPSGISLVFELVVTDSKDATSMDSCIVNVIWVNVPPIADAGGEQTVSEGALVTLDATNSIDPDDGIIEYHWQQLQGPAVTIPEDTSAAVSFNAPDTGPEGASLTFQLTVTDAGGLKDSDISLINVSWINTPPLADAGPDQRVFSGDEVFLDGSLSTDTDGDLIVSYRWRQTDGAPVELSDATAEKPSFEAPDVSIEGGTLSFELTVEDGGGLLGKDTCQVVMDAPEEATEDITAPELAIQNPSADAITLSTSRINMSGSTWDDLGVEKVVWKNNRGGSGVAVGTNQWQIQKISLRYGTNIITITATDASGNSTSVSKTVVVKYNWWWWWR